MNPRSRTRVPFDQPFTIDDVTRNGITLATLRGWKARREVVQIAPGLFVPTELADDASTRAIHTAKSVSRGRASVSALGSAVLHGLATPLNPHRSLAHTPTDHVVPAQFLRQHGRLLVPDVTWTSLQVARYQRLPGALIPLDAALRLGVTRDDLLRALPFLENWPGAKRLPLAIEHADAKSGSPLESWSRGLMVEHDIPSPLLQPKLRVAGFTYYPDFLWREARLIGEADGRGKYSDPAEIENEKRRQARLQAEGYTLYRWGWPEVAGNCTAWLRGLEAALRRRAA